jgi:hypothetical protein
LRVADVYGAPSDAGGHIRAVPSCAWDEKTVTWNTRPTPATGEIDRAGAVEADERVDFELAPAIRGDGVCCFALDTGSDNGGHLQCARGGLRASRGRPHDRPTPHHDHHHEHEHHLHYHHHDDHDDDEHHDHDDAAPVISVTEADVVVNERAKDTNYGGEPVLEIDRDPRTRAFLRVRGVGKRRVVTARLQLPVASETGAASDSGGRVSWIEDCDWDEDTATWNNQPDRAGQELRMVGDVAAGELVEIHATEFVDGDGAYCFMIETESKNAVLYESRETPGGGPALALQVTP